MKHDLELLEWETGSMNSLGVGSRRDRCDWKTLNPLGLIGLNALKEPLTLTLHLKDFNLSTPNIYIDNKSGAPSHSALKLDKKGTVKVTIQPNGGLIIK